MFDHLFGSRIGRGVAWTRAFRLGLPVSRHRRLREKLAMDRPMTSLLDQEIAAASNDIMLERENWIEALVDYGHAVSFQRIETTAYRALNTHDGNFFWLVRRVGKVNGYHAEAPDPLCAIEEAIGAWKARQSVRRNWSDVENLSRDLILGRRRVTVRIEDAYASPLCTMGVNAFMRRFGLSQVRVLSGRVAALLIWIDPQVGFVVHQAHIRELRQAECLGSLALVAAE